MVEGFGPRLGLGRAYVGPTADGIAGMERRIARMEVEGPVDRWDGVTKGRWIEGMEGSTGRRIAGTEAGQGGCESRRWRVEGMADRSDGGEKGCRAWEWRVALGFVALRFGKAPQYSLKLQEN